MSLPPVAPLVELADPTCGALRDRCSAAGYTEDVVAEMEGIAPGMFGREVRPLILHVLARRGDAASSLARLFAYGDALPESLVRDLLGDLLVDALLDIGLLSRADATADGIRCPFELRPFKGLWLLADDPTAGRDAVMPPAGTTHQLAQLMPPACSGSVLDVGCGPGSLGLAAALRGAIRVVGTDVNQRAVDLATFNTRLNGLQANFLTGDLLEPVKGQRFDLVVSQPPFVIQPPDAQAVTFLHGGPSGEELGLRLLAGLPGVMSESARSLVLLEAVARPDEALHARMRPAIGDAPVDLLVLAAPGAPPALQVIAYATLEVPEGGPAYPAAARRYLEQLDRIHAAEFQLALVVLRARSTTRGGRGRLAATVPIASLGRGDSEALERLLAGVDLAALDDSTLIDRAVSASKHTRWVEERAGPDAALEPARLVRFGPGSFGSDLALSAERYAMASMLDRAPSIGRALHDYAATANATTGSVEREMQPHAAVPEEASGPLGEAMPQGAQTSRLAPDALRRQLLSFVREGLMRGLFEPRAINPAVTSD